MADTQLCMVPYEEKQGMFCREPGTINDPQRGRMVCSAHKPHPVRKKLLDGTLSMDLQPSMMAGTTFVIGKGAGEPCAVCDQPIAPEHPKHVYYDPADPSRTVCFHMGSVPDCATIYTREQDVVRSRRDQPTS